MNRVYYSYSEFIDDLKILVKRIDFNFDAILAVARGGMSIAHMLGEYFNIREVFSVNSIGYEDREKLDEIKIFNLPDLSGCKNVLIVDDIVDSGETMKSLVERINKSNPTLNIKTASIFYKKSSTFKPDFFVKYTNSWIDFFWSVDLKGKNGFNDR